MKYRTVLSRGRLTVAALALSLGDPCAETVFAQGTAPALELPRPADEGAELPDIDAIEKGAKARASVSFGQNPVAPNPDSAGRGNTTVKRIEAGPAAQRSMPAGGIYGMESAYPDEGARMGAHADTIPLEHVIKEGDTLWALCEFYFHDPLRWPQLWAQNPHVSNPHWLFAGDVLKLREPDAPARVKKTDSGVRLTSNRKGSLESQAVLIRQFGFIESGELKRTARISGSREEKIMLSSGDQAYVSFAKDRPLKAGDRYSIFVADTEHPVVAPDGKAVLGYMVRVYGDLLVDQVLPNQMARGSLVDLMEPVERGYLISPFVQQFKRIEPKPSTMNLEARVVAAFSPAIMASAESFVVLSHGSKEGIALGNRSYVVRRGDGYKQMIGNWQKQDPNFPREIVGEVWVVDVRESASVAWVARSSKELQVGEVVEFRRGY